MPGAGETTPCVDRAQESCNLLEVPILHSITVSISSEKWRLKVL